MNRRRMGLTSLRAAAIDSLCRYVAVAYARYTDDFQCFEIGLDCGLQQCGGMPCEYLVEALHGRCRHRHVRGTALVHVSIETL